MRKIKLFLRAFFVITVALNCVANTAYSQHIVGGEGANVSYEDDRGYPDVRRPSEIRGFEESLPTPAPQRRQRSNSRKSTKSLTPYWRSWRRLRRISL